MCSSFERDGQTLVGYPALVDHVTHCSIEVFDMPARADAQHRAGLRRLFRLQLKEQVKFLEKSLGEPADDADAGLERRVAWRAHCRAMKTFASRSSRLRSIGRACVPPLPTDRDSFIKRKDDARGRLSLIAQELARLVTAIVEQAATIARRLPH